MIGYHCNHLDGQLNYQVFTHCVISRTTKLSTVQSVIVAWHTPPTALGWLVAGNKAYDGSTSAKNTSYITLHTVNMARDHTDFKCRQKLYKITNIIITKCTWHVIVYISKYIHLYKFTHDHDDSI